MNLKKKKSLKGEGMEESKVVDEEVKGSPPKVLPRLQQRRNKKITDD